MKSNDVVKFDGIAGKVVFWYYVCITLTSRAMQFVGIMTSLRMHMK